MLLAGLLLAQGPALAQERDRSRMQRQEAPARERDSRESFSRERTERHQQQQQREQRFTREERDKLRQDVMDANREMRGRRQGRQ